MWSGKKPLRVVAGIIRRQRQILLCQRKKNGPHPLQWEFPGGKIESGEEPERALVREFDEELSLEIIKQKPIFSKTFTYPNDNLYIELFFFHAWTRHFAWQNRVFAAVEWVDQELVSVYDLLAADAAFWPEIQHKLQ
jgi:8-oxo-dGTP diphosphatase